MYVNMFDFAMSILASTMYNKNIHEAVILVNKAAITYMV